MRKNLIFIFAACLSVWSATAQEIAVGICTTTDNAQKLAAAGARYLEGNVQVLLLPDRPFTEFRNNLEQVRKSPIPTVAANGLFPKTMLIVGPDATPEKAVAWADTVFSRAALCGIRCIVFGSGTSRRIPEGFSREEAERQFVGLCKQLGVSAQRNGIVVVIEPLNRAETNFINSVGEGAGIVRQVDHPNIRLLCDLYHMARENEPAQSIVDAGNLIRHCHIAEKEKRTAPGIAGDDFTPYLEALKKSNYQGIISVEGKWNDFDTELKPAVEEIKRQWNSL